MHLSFAFAPVLLSLIFFFLRVILGAGPLRRGRLECDPARHEFADQQSARHHVQLCGKHKNKQAREHMGRKAKDGSSLTIAVSTR